MCQRRSDIVFVQRKASTERGPRVVVKISRAERAANKAAREQVAAQLERRWAKTLGRWNTPAMVSEIEGHIETQGTVGLIDGPLKYGDLEAEIGAAMDEGFRDALGRGREIGLRFSGLRGVELDPALATQRAVQWIESTGAERIAGITGGMRQSVQRFLTEQITDRISPTEAARKIGRVVGLDDRGIKALKTFEDRLIRVRIPTPEADTVRVRRAINQDVERYLQRLLRDRGRRIAETETQVAIHQGEKQWWDQAVAEGHVERPEAAQKRWVIVGDGTCPHCRAKPPNGTVVPIDGVFATSLGVVSAPPLHVRCRCYLEYSAEGFG